MMPGLRWFVLIFTGCCMGVAILPTSILYLLTFLSAMCVAGVAYLVHLANQVSVPEGISNPDVVRPNLAMGNLLRYVFNEMVFPQGMTADRLGFSGPSAVRAVFKILGFIMPPTSPLYKVTSKDMNFNGVPVRVYTPSTTEEESVDRAPKRAVLYLRGGGWMFGSLDGYDELCKMMCQDLQAICVSIDYRLAPEHVYPAAIEDCFAAAEYFMKHAESFNVDPYRIAIVGDSAGGTLAASVTQRMKDRNIEPQFKMQALIYPTVQALDFDTPSMRANSSAVFLTRDFFVWFYNHYLFGNQRNFDKMRLNNHTGIQVKETLRSEYMKLDDLPQDEIIRDYLVPPPSDGDAKFWDEHKAVFMNPDFAPLMTKIGNLKGLPHTFILSCHDDILRDDAFHYAARLRKESVSVVHVCLKHCYHGWWSANLIRKVDTFREHYQTFINHVDGHL